MTPRVFTYRIDPSNLPKGAEACIVWALDQYTNASEGRIRFSKAKKADILFSGGKPASGAHASHFDLGGGVHSIIYDPSLPWATTWWHRFLGMIPDFRRLTLHELGHVILGADHSDDPTSIMHARPKVSAIDPATIQSLRS